MLRGQSSAVNAAGLPLGRRFPVPDRQVHECGDSQGHQAAQAFPAKMEQRDPQREQDR